MSNIKAADNKLQPVSLQKLRNISMRIDSAYRKDQLTYICHSIQEHCAPDATLTLEHGPGEIDCYNIIAEYFATKNGKKSVYANFVALFLSSFHNFAIYLNSLPPNIRKVWSDVLYTKLFKYNDEIGDTEWIDATSWFSEYYIRDYSFYCDEVTCLTLEPIAYELVSPYLKDYFTHPQIVCKSEEELTASDQISIYSNVEGIDSEFFIMDKLMKQNKELASGYTLAVATIKSVVNQLQFPLPVKNSTTNLAFNKTAASLFMYAYIDTKYFMKRLIGSTSIYEGMRSSLKLLFGNSYVLHTRYLPHLKKQTSRLSESANQSFLIESLINVFAQVMNSDMKGWYDIESLVSLAVMYTRPSSALFYEPYAYYYQNVKRRDTGPIGPDTAIKEVVNPLAKAILLMCATMGLCDLALDLSRVDDVNSYVEPIRYVRFNAMARYVFCLDDKMPEMEKAKSNMADDFTLSDDHLVVYVRRKSRFAGMLSEYAVRLTPTLWRVSHSTFMRNCTTMAEMKQKIDTFKKNICPEPPQNWQDFFKELPSRFNVLEQSEKGYTVFNVPKDRTDIQRLLLSDPVLSKLAIRAEGYLVMVDNLNFMKFRKRFTELGYTLG